MPRNPAIAFRLPQEELDRLEDLAKREQRSLSNLVRLIVTAHLEQAVPHEGA
jgi:predicted DNA-binding protein